jgi:pimeloyl-ACP methyl ester carboxylesterase
VVPITSYARSGEVNIAFQAFGDGPCDLVFAPGFISHIELAWEEPYLAQFLRWLAAFTRVIFFDKRGTGLSDPVSRPPGLAERMDDIRAVMDAAGWRRAALFGVSDGGCLCIAFAVAYPDRSASLVTYRSFARRLRTDRASSLAGEAQYAFAHVLVRDVAYGQIPRAVLASENAQAVGWIEALGRTEDHAEMLAHHYLSALELARAASQDTTALAAPARAARQAAGDRAFALKASAEAAGYYRAALALWPQDTQEQRAGLLRLLGTMLYMAGELEQAETVVSEGAEVAAAALTLYRVTGERRWLTAAHRLDADAVRAAANEEAPAHQLFAGQLGVMLLAVELADPAGAAMPVYEAIGG